MQIPCYVLDSVKPLWQGEVKNCGLVLGTNALVAFGIQVAYSNEAPIHPVSIVAMVPELTVPTTEIAVRVVLSKVARLGPRQSKCVRER